jgi:hypothetical protein
MCFDDRTKKDFAEMVWIHILKSFTHFEHENVGYPWEVTKNSDIEVIFFAKNLDEPSNIIASRESYCP